jgi:phosphatidylglycerol:prolipoprotein diacylglycerol transferase
MRVQLKSGQERQLTIPPWDNSARGTGLDRLGLKIHEAAGGLATVTQIAAGEPFDQAGFVAGDQIQQVRLPPTSNVEIVENVMQWAGPRVTLETDRASISWTTGRLPTRSLPIHPTQIYSTVTALLIFFFLWFYYPFRTRDGEVFAWMILIYPVARFLEEAIRIDEPAQFGTGLSISQLISVAILIAAVALWTYLVRRPSGSVLPAPREESLVTAR